MVDDESRDIPSWPFCREQMAAEPGRRVYFEDDGSRLGIQIVLDEDVDTRVF